MITTVAMAPLKWVIATC